MSLGEDDFTPREIARALRRLEVAMSELRHEVATLGFVRQDVWSVERDSIVERIEQVRVVAAADVAEVAGDLGRTQENLRWLARAVAAVVIAAVLGWVFSSAGISP